MVNLWRYISDIGIKPGYSLDFTRKINLINQMCFVGTLTTFIFVLHLWFIHNMYYLPFQLATGVLCSLYIFSSSRGYFYLSISWVLSILFLNILFASVEIPNCGVEYFLIPLSFIPFTVVEDKRICVAFGIITTIGFISSHFLQATYKPHHVISAFYTEVSYLMTLTSTFIISSIVIFQFKIINAKYETIINEQKLEVESKNKDITDSINYAQRIQQAKLPQKEEICEALPDSFVLFKPKDIVSGDFYFFSVQPAGTVFLAAADCTGHGVPGALMSMVGSEQLEDAVSQSADTSAILRLLNKGIKTSLRQSDSDGSTRDGMDIALCAIDTKKRQLSFAGANRPFWLIRNGKTELEEIKATKKAIGGLTGDEQQFEAHTVQLEAGDTFYLSTDGYADSFSGKNGKKMTTKRFKELLLSIQQLSMREQEKFLDNFVEDWKAGTEQVDDILVIGVRL